MSHAEYTVYGYGICVTEIEDELKKDDARLLSILERAPKLKAKIEKRIADGKIKNALEYKDDDERYTGLLPIMRDAILEAEDIELEMDEDYDCYGYLRFEPSYPWQEGYEGIETREDADDLFRRWTAPLTNKPVKPDYLEIER